MSWQQWVNIDDDGAIHALLGRLAERVPVPTIDTLWIFPTRRSTGIESTVIVISAFDGNSPDRRRVGAVRWIVHRDRRGRATIEEHVHEYANAPDDALPRIVDGVMRRLGEETLEPPRAISIAGNDEHWDDFLRELGAPADTRPRRVTTSGDDTPPATAEAHDRTASPSPDPMADRGPEFTESPAPHE